MPKFRVFLERKVIEALTPIEIEANTAADAEALALLAEGKDDNGFEWSSIDVDEVYVQAVEEI